MLALPRILILAEALTFAVASLLHLGLAVPIAAALGEALMPQAGVPEGIIGLVLLGGAVASFARGRASWAIVLGTHLFAIGGTLVGMASLAAGLAPRTDANEIYHRVIIVVLVVVTALLFTRGARAALAPTSR